MISIEDIVLVALFILLVTLGMLLLRRRSPIQSERPGKEIRQSEIKDFLTPAEHSFMAMLDEVAGSDLRVFAKVPLSYLLRDRKITLRGKAKKAVEVELADFILCRNNDYSVVGIVLLDPESKDDSPVEKALGSIGLVVARFSAKRLPPIQKLRQVIAEMKASSTPDDSFAPADDWTIGAVSGQAPAADDEWHLGAPLKKSTGKEQGTAVEEPLGENTERTCPACGGAMIRRRATRGPQAGKFFWSCTDYPRCPQVLHDSPDK